VREFRISVDLGHLMPTGAYLSSGAFPHLAHAVQAVAEGAAARWRAYAAGMPLPTGKAIQNRTGEYARSIQLRQTGDFSAEVYSELPYALAIEQGAPARDMKKMLDSSLKVRLNAKGRRYLIIPFRWNTPGAATEQRMPEAVHVWFRGRRPSRVTAQTERPSGTGAFGIKSRQPIQVPAWRYRSGARLTAADLEGMGITGTPAARMAGMVNFRQPGGKGGAAHSQFITFRVMSEGSRGWIAAAQEGKWPARTVADEMRPIAERAFAKAVEEDVIRLLGA
jgi:hypothetical protein